MRFQLQAEDGSLVRIVDQRGMVWGVITPTQDGVRIRGSQIAVTLAYGSGEDPGDGCKILLEPAADG
jgi:hypothetical protein